MTGALISTLMRVLGAIAPIAPAAIGLALYVITRSFERRFDSHAQRLSRIEAAFGLEVNFPYEVACPDCGAAEGTPCSGATHFDKAHRARFEASPAARAAKAKQQ